MDHNLIHTSHRNFRNMWQRYRIYRDRVELPFFFGLITIKIPATDIVSIDIFPPFVFRTALWALKLDFADFYHHVGIKRRSGFFKCIRFTPDDPQVFIAKVRELISG